MVNQIEFFTNDKFKVLQILNDHKVESCGEIFTPITQREIADIMSCSIIKINQIINELIKNGYIKIYKHTKARYILTDTAINIIKKINKLKE